MINIRKAVKSDQEFIVKGQRNLAKETEDLDLDPEILMKGTSYIFENEDRGFYLIAEAENKPVACLLILKEWSDWRCKDVLWIHSVYVSKTMRRKNVFTLMYEHIKNIVNDSSSFAGIRLYVEKNNYPAKSAYRKLNMSDEHYELFEWLV